MNRLEKILNHHISGGPGAWKKLYDDLEELINNVAEETLKSAAINVSMKMKDNAYELDMMDDILEVDRASILNKNNIPKL